MNPPEETSAVLRLSVNGQERELPGPITLADLLARLGLDPRQVAVERNEKLVRREAYRDTELRDGDRVEIVTFLGGG